MGYSDELYIQRKVDEAAAEATRIERERCLSMLLKAIDSLMRQPFTHGAHLAAGYVNDVYNMVAKDDFEHGILEAGKILNGEETS